MKSASLAIAASLALTSCIVVPIREPIVLVELDVAGSPRVGPGGPSIYVDGLYRGNPIDDRFVMWMKAGRHDVRVMGGSLLLWEGPIQVDEENEQQTVTIRYDVDPDAAEE